jgi:hypothetical protein
LHRRQQWALGALALDATPHHADDLRHLLREAAQHVVEADDAVDTSVLPTGTSRRRTACCFIAAIASSTIATAGTTASLLLQAARLSATTILRCRCLQHSWICVDDSCEPSRVAAFRLSHGWKMRS